MEQLNAEDLEAVTDLVVGMKQDDYQEKSLVLRLIIALSDDDDTDTAMDGIRNYLGNDLSTGALPGDEESSNG
jgi:hypothetical protein